jgi:uncharacterized protein YjbI with pentapeptide repeats
MGDTTTVPHNVHVRLNVSGAHLHTSLHTVMEGARLGYGCFQMLCVKILQASHDSSQVWDRVKLVPIKIEKNCVEHFIDADPTHFLFWLGYFRTRKVPYVERGLLRERLICESEEAGLKDLADALRELVDYRQAELRGLLERPGSVLHGARLQGQDLSWLGFGDCSLACADLSGCNLSYCSFRGADLSGADLRNTIWHHAKLKGADLSGADLRDADLSAADLSGANLFNAKLQGARLPPWSSGLLEGVKLAGVQGWMPADKDLSNAKLRGADLSGCDLSGVNLQGTVLKGVGLSKCDLSSADLSNAKLQGAVLKGADLSKCDLSGADLTGADLREAKLEGTTLRGATLCAVLLHAAQGARPATKVPVTNAKILRLGKPVVFALTAPRALTLQRVTLQNFFVNTGDVCGQDVNCAKEMEVQTGPSATGPWTSVVKFTSRQTTQNQTFAAAPDAPLLFGFVQVLVHDTYGGEACVRSMELEGEAWG